MCAVCRLGVGRLSVLCTGVCGPLVAFALPVVTIIGLFHASTNEKDCFTCEVAMVW